MKVGARVAVTNIPGAYLIEESGEPYLLGEIVGVFGSYFDVDLGPSRYSNTWSVREEGIIMVDNLSDDEVWAAYCAWKLTR